MEEQKTSEGDLLKDEERHVERLLRVCSEDNTEILINMLGNAQRGESLSKDDLETLEFAICKTHEISFDLLKVKRAQNPSFLAGKQFPQTFYTRLK